MYNLLPQENHKELRKEYWLRIAVAAFAFLFILSLIVCVAFFPSYLAAFFNDQSASKQNQAFQATNATSSASVLSALQSGESELALVSQLQTESMHDLIAQLASYQTPGITLIGFSIGHLSGKTRPVTLTGVAATREDLAAFSQSLQSVKQLSGVNVPVSDFSVQKNIGFTLNLSLAVQ